MLEVILTLVTSLVVPVLTKALTKSFDLNGLASLWLMYLISVLLAIGVVFISGQLHVTDVLATVSIVSSVAQTIYHAFLKEQKRTEER